MKKRITALSIIAVLMLSCTAGCSGSEGSGEYKFKNASFESGNLDGWTVEGNAFPANSVSRKSVSAGGDTFWQEGRYFLCGEAASKGTIGSAMSEVFKLKGNGKIGYLIGGGAHPDKCYVALCDESGKELMRVGNKGYGATGFHDGMYRTVMDASAYTGKKVRIKIVDNDDGTEMGDYLNVDDFIVNYKGEAEIPGGPLIADKYIASNSPLVAPTYRHTYHVMPPVGWMNDPNGFSYALGKYHFFYQFHPYAAAWGPMHWGHYTTSDFVKWELQPTAIAPDATYDRDGCFSGTAIEKDGKMYLMYTSVSGGRQTQAIARSSDGVHFIKSGEVISSEQIPVTDSRADFRDPKVFYRDGSYYAMMGSRSGDGDGQILLYKSQDLYRWEYVGVVRKDNKTPRGIYECPDIFTIGDTDVILTSPQGYKTDDWRYENVHSAIYVTGKLNTATGAFTATYEDEIDSGLDFYAPQTLKAADGRIIMTAWMQMWVRSMPTADDGWAGAAILPRELTLKDGKLYQAPVREIEKYRKNAVQATNVALDSNTTVKGVTGNKVELEVTFDLGTADEVGVKVYCGSEHNTRIYYSRSRDRVIFDRSDMGPIITFDALENDAKVRSVKVDIKDNRLTMRIFLDVSSCEVFLNGGERTMTGNVYSNPEDTDIAFYAKGSDAKIVSLKKYDIVV